MTVSRSWLADCPAWEKREVGRHYNVSTDCLASDFLPTPIPYREALERRRAGEPLEYILNHCHIGPLTLKTDSRALIPRPETETLLRIIGERLNDLPPGPLLDCGCGSGFIAAWLKKYSSSDRVVATDIDPEALKLAQENFSCNGLEVKTVCTDRLEGIRAGLALVVANLPYVLPGAKNLNETVKKYEPHRALFIPTTALEFYGIFFQQAIDKLLPGGELWLEATPKLIKKFNSYLQSCDYRIKIDSHRDLTGRIRYLQVKLS